MKLPYKLNYLTSNPNLNEVLTLVNSLIDYLAEREPKVCPKNKCRWWCVEGTLGECYTTCIRNTNDNYEPKDEPMPPQPETAVNSNALHKQPRTDKPKDGIFVGCSDVDPSHPNHKEDYKALIDEARKMVEGWYYNQAHIEDVSDKYELAMTAMEKVIKNQKTCIESLDLPYKNQVEWMGKEIRRLKEGIKRVLLYTDRCRMLKHLEELIKK